MNPQRRYLETKVKTASPQQLMIMLFDGAIRLAQGAKTQLGARDYAASCNSLIRAQKILLELIGGLDQEALGPEIYGKLSSHYWFIHGRLVRANVDHELQWLDEALSILVQIRDQWERAVAAGEEQVPLSGAPPEPSGRVPEGALPSVNLEG
jgi:flagellar protein FliS